MIKILNKVIDTSTSVIKNMGDGVETLGNTIKKIGDTLESVFPQAAKQDKIEQLEEKHKKDMATVRKIKKITKNFPITKEEKIQKDEKLKRYFDELLGGEQ